ncbi:MAG: UDP-N-acetylmuramoyl-tripeptide--D-alanyl-D-alanine ligase [Elusimicrobiales bacterium]|jgi:UDP-N-acetylmuramoyl-tripeptide--D-alanyl-D-alanine ligase
MDLNTNIGTLAEITNGRVIKGGLDAPFNSFEADTRKLKGGDFFWAFRGGAHDAHAFLEETLAKSVKGWIVEDNKIGRFDKAAYPEFVIGVWDTLKALHRLAAWHRGRFRIPLAAVTGSNGKSTTKEMLRSIFAESGPACSNAGNLNNHFGLPLSLLELRKEHKFGVFELGASKKGDIFEIGSLARPTVAVITNIGPSHLEYFGDLETIFRTKAEIVDCLEPGGTLVYNADDKYLAPLKDRRINKLSFGCYGADITISDSGGLLKLGYKGASIEVRLPSAVRHNYRNAAAAAGAAIASGLDLTAVKAGLEAFVPPPMRMQILEINGAAVILDAYNANPASMRAALETAFGSSFKKPFYLALGDMKELGRHSERYHSELGEYLSGLDAERIFLAGPEMKAAAKELEKRGKSAKVVYAESAEAWARDLRAAILDGRGTFLLKASRAMKFEKLIEGL